MCRIDRLAQPLVKAVCRAGLQSALIECCPQQREQRVFRQSDRRFTAICGLLPHGASRRRQERCAEREIAVSQMRSQQTRRGKAAVRRTRIVGRALPEHRKRTHPEREQEAAVFHGKRVVRVVQKSCRLFVDFAEFFLPSGGVGQVRRAGFSLHRQAVQEFCRL